MDVQAADDTVDFGERLERECSEIARSRPPTCRVTLTCTTARALVSLPVAAALLAAAQILVRWAYEAVDSGPGGRIGVSFSVTENALELRIEHSHPMGWAVVSEDREGELLLQRAVALTGGHFEAREVIGGCQWLVTMPASR